MGYRGGDLVSWQLGSTKLTDFDWSFDIDPTRAYAQLAAVRSALNQKRIALVPGAYCTSRVSAYLEASPAIRRQTVGGLVMVPVRGCTKVVGLVVPVGV